MNAGPLARAAWLAMLLGASAVLAQGPSAGGEGGSHRDVDDWLAFDQDTAMERSSLPLEDADDAWRQAGFRFSLALAKGAVTGFDDAIDTDGWSLDVRPAVRVDRLWSVGVSLSYAVALGDMLGVRWSTLLEPTLHPVAGLWISAGVGLAGMSADLDWSVRDQYDMPDWIVWDDDEVVSRNVQSDERLYGCNGVGPKAALRLGYDLVVGHLFATGPVIEATYERLRCEEDTWYTDPESGLPVRLRAWWPYAGWQLGWRATWR